MSKLRTLYRYLTLNPERHKDSDYTTPISVPKFLSETFGIPERLPDRRVRRYGRVRGNVFYYITPTMIFITAFVVTMVLMNIDMLMVYFNTNVYLNGLIISFLVFAIFKTYHNCYKLFRAAHFIRHMENVIHVDKITEQHVKYLRHFLEKKASLLNTVSMTETIENILEFGHPNFNDQRARLIKSKLGYRVGKNKSNIGFVSGLLVMLGLLGTFLGLLGTIDAVGEAMNSMSSIGGENGEVGVEEMTGFIGSLSKPLQGMGLAFSSSLFGLSGSLMIGFFLHISGKPQNEFLENASRWIDDRLGKYNPDLQKERQEQKMTRASDDDLREWLTGFLQMSAKTNRNMDELSSVLMSSTQETQSIFKEIRTVTQTQARTNQAFDSLDTNMHAIQSAIERLAQITEATQMSIQSIDQSNRDIASIGQGTTQKIEALTTDTNALAQNMSRTGDMFSSYVKADNQGLQKSLEASRSMQQLLQQSCDLQKKMLAYQERHQGEMQNSERNQSALIEEIRALLKRFEDDKLDMRRTQSLLERLHGFLQDFRGQ